jgi:hypothetical protein
VDGGHRQSGGRGEITQRADAARFGQRLQQLEGTLEARSTDCTPPPERSAPTPPARDSDDRDDVTTTAFLAGFGKPTQQSVEFLYRGN